MRERVLRLNPSHDLAHFNLGVAEFEAGRPEEGLREMRRAIELAPEASHYALELARYNARAGDYRGAERWLDRASDLTPSGSPQRSQIEGLARQLEASRASTS